MIVKRTNIPILLSIRREAKAKYYKGQRATLYRNFIQVKKVKQIRMFSKDAGHKVNF